MLSIVEEYERRFKEETRELLYQRVLAVLLVGIILIPFFSILDYVVVREYFKLFFIYRIICSFSLFLLLLVYFTKFGKDYAIVLVTIAYFIAALTISMMCVKMGGYPSFYYAGLMMVTVTVVILPINAVQAFMAGFMIYMIYLLPTVLLTEPTSDSVKIFFSNSFFFIGIVLIITIQAYEETKNRKRECKLKTDMDALAERLSYYAHNLEAEVEKRMKELKESELRYRELYENIIDIVILVDRHAKILMANPRFYDTIGIPSDQKLDFSFMNLVKGGDTPLVERMFDRLPTEQTVNDFQFRIVNRIGRVFDVECNAKCIYKDSDLIGFQMVIRDITVRKKLERDLLDSYKKVQSARNATILGLAKLAEYRDADTGAHLERIREYAKILALELAKMPKYSGYITPEYIEDIYNSSILHDIGKVGIPDSILLKPGKLTRDEFEVVKRHSSLGGEALKAVESKIEGQSFLSLGKEIAFYHHEKWDGTGYPRGLKGDQIPLSARIVALADVYDALTSKRVYKEAFSHDKAIAIIAEDRGRHFDPDVVDAFLALEDDFRSIREVMFKDVEVEEVQYSSMQN
ncbi:MAG TPA: PAS domain S-box protein [Deltaproteobacteria bacterium]|nr:PAS domain S-box protein [Deltaproteobacteria bacterium]HOI08252.1 PAS domain S-box protein [Deltaproteobacteria bacterium]